LRQTLDYVWNKYTFLTGIDRPAHLSIDVIANSDGFLYSSAVPINKTYRQDLDDRRLGV
jgi:hypothetical protein